MSDEMAVNDTATGEESNANCDNAEVEGPAETIEAIAEAASRPTTEDTEELNLMEAESQDPEVQLEIKTEVLPDSKAEDRPENPTEIKATSESELKPDSISEAQPDLNMEVNAQPETGAETETPDEPKVEMLCNETHDLLAPVETKPEISGDQTPQVEDTEEMRGIKRRGSETFSDQNDEEFIGFEKADPNDSTLEYSRVLERMEAEVQTASESFTRVRSVIATPPAVRAIKRPRQDTDGSRPSSGLSSRSDEDGMSGADGASGAGAGGRSRRPATAQLLVPLERGWKRELVHRATLDSHLRRNADIYYYTPAGKKLRSMREISEHLSGTGLTMDNFSFFKEPLGLDDPEKEIIRDAKMQRRVESPVSSPAPAPALVESKRAPKPKRVSPDPAAPTPAAAAPKSPPTKIKVKSVGSRLAGNGAASAKKKGAAAPGASADNNNSAAWKKPSENRRGRIANGASPPPAAAPSPAAPSLLSPRRRARPRSDDTDYFTPFYNTAQERNYNVALQIFPYLGMRDLARAAQVCRQWRQIAAAPALWRHVRMKNSHVSDWGGLCAALKRHGTARLDLRKMLLPQSDAAFWEQFAAHIHTVDTLERIEMCRCPAMAVEAVCRVRGLRALSALAIRDALLDPAPLALLPRLHELRLKSMAGLSLTGDLRPLHKLTQLHHLSLTSIKELGWCACEVVGELQQLESLELGECTFRAEFGLVLARLRRLRRLRLERGTAQCAAPALLRALAPLPLLTRLELVNIDVKVGFDDALAECKNIQRLLIIPTYVSQSATTNKQVLSGVLRLKDSLTHLMWGVTIELLRVTELFIDQCDQSGDSKKKDIGECIPVLKPVPGCKLPDEHHHVAGPPQVEILPLPTLQRLLAAQLPNTKLKLLRIPFHATWRQSLADFQ